MPHNRVVRPKERLDVPTIAWMILPPVLLIALVVLVVAARPGSARALALVLSSLEGPLRVVVPWRIREREGDTAHTEGPPSV
jgi:hypothetical protein